MTLSLDNIGKRFKFHWIFRNVTIELESGQVLTVKGPNGSGKSTLLKIISGFLSPSEGKIDYSDEGKLFPDYFSHVTFAAPYVDLIDQMTLTEHLNFHLKFKPFKKALDVEKVIDILDLNYAADKAIKDFSSGMKQRVRLGLAILSESNICILDEPSTNLDSNGFDWYADLIHSFRGNTAYVIASNEPRDFIIENISIDIRAFK